MKPKIHLSNRAFWIVFLAGLAVAAGLYVSLVLIPYGTETAALRVTRNVEKRLKEMDRLILECSENDGEGSEDALESVPPDIVIYRYVGDSLQTWYNQFTEINDDISSKLIFARITDSPNRLYSPLNKAGEEVRYINMGPKWYLVKAVGEEGGVRTVAGLEIKNSIVGRHFAGRNGVNPKLHLGGQYDIVPLSEESGTAVNVFGRPVFKITGDILGIRNEAIDHSLFSPLVYADGPVLSSLGALLLYNTLLTAVLLAVYLMRQKSVRRLRGSRHPRRYTIIYGIGILLLCAFSCAYIHITIKSLIYNSGLLMEFFRFNFNSNFGFSALTFLSYILLIIMTLFQLFSFKVVFTEFTGKNINTRSAVWPVVFACICALYLTVVSGVYGFRKEERRAWGWADRLAIERDLGMEMQLLTVEDAIADDPVIGALIDKPHNERPIRNRITEVLLGRMAESTDIGVTLVRSGDRTGRQAFDEILATGTRISDNSRFFWCDSGEGRDGYSGLFAYRGKDGGINRLIISIAENREVDPYGYRRILPRTSGISGNGIPSFYSYAKYRNNRLKSFRGDYPYPTVTDHIKEMQMGASGHDFFRYKGCNHFCSKVGNGDIVVISRPTRKFTSYFTSFSIIFLLTFILVSVFRKERKRRDEGRNLLRTKINLLVITSLTLTLAAISLISVIFVYDRNEMNMTRLMSAKINTVQALLEKRCQHLSSCYEMSNPAFYGSLSEYAQITRTDITLYTPSGKVYISTVPEIFESLAVGSRIDREAYRNITDLSQRYFIHKEEIAGNGFYALYAPVFNAEGTMIAIAGCPYTDNDYNFKSEAVLHASLIVCLFFMLLLLSIRLSSVVTNNLFRHLSKLSWKMARMDIHNLEPIKYRGNDEVSVLVETYNKMVGALAESSAQLAKAERDSAWSEMARQVAHEIKNSLTPIKLKIQKLMRLRENGSEDWDAKFDDTARVILEHIDTLAETASGFSAIAKLYGEQASEVDVDKMLSEQAFMFDNRENVKITYIGLAGARVLAPQSQLMRVFINLITNALQAVEIRQKEQAASGAEPDEGQIVICLRNSTDEGFYEIAVDDNGTGVEDENLGKLFVPNFTTKSSGTGLGLSICRSIVESCNGSITYRRSYALGGACFVIRLPRLA